MKRYYDDKGGLVDDGLDDSIRHLHESFKTFVEAGYSNKDFIQFVIQEITLWECDTDANGADKEWGLGDTVEAVMTFGTPNITVGKNYKLEGEDRDAPAVDADGFVFITDDFGRKSVKPKVMFKIVRG